MISRSLARLRANDFLRDGSYVFAGVILTNLSNYAYHAVISRGLGPDRYGVVASLLAALVIVTVPTAIATTVIVTYASEFHALGDASHVRGLTARVTRFGLLSGAVLFALGAALAVPIARYLHIEDVSAVVIMALAVGLGVTLPLLRGILQGTQRFRAFAISSSMEAVGKAIFGVALVLAGFGVTGAVGAYALSIALTLAYTRFAAGPVRGGAPIRLDPARVWRTTGVSSVAILCLTVLGFGDIVLVKHYFTPLHAGLYGAIALSGKLLLFAISFIPQLVLPKAAGRVAAGHSTRGIFFQAGGVIALGAAVFLGVLWLAPALVLRVLVGPAYLAATPLVLPYGVAMTCLAVTMLIANFEIARHRFRFAIPLALATIGELAGIVAYHHSVAEVVSVVVAANAAAVIVAGADLALNSAFVRASAAAALFAVSLTAWTGCTRTTSGNATNFIVPAPAQAFAIAAVARGSVAVLAGDDRSKGVFIISVPGGEQRSFSVSKDATAIGTTSSGVILLGLGMGSAGAVEMWTATGQHQSTIAVSGPVVGMAGSAGTPYAIVAHGRMRAAERLDVAHLRVDRVVPLPAGVTSASDCTVNEPALIMANERLRVRIVRLRDTKSVTVGPSGRNPQCAPGAHAIYVLTPTGTGRDDVALVVANLRTLLQVREVPVGRYARVFAVLPDGDLYLLAGDGRVSTVTAYARDKLAVVR